MSYRTNFRVPIPRGRYYDYVSNRLYQRVQNVPRRADSIIASNRVWRAQPNEQLLLLNVVQSQRVLVPFISSVMPPVLRDSAVVTEAGNVLSLGFQPGLSDTSGMGDVLDVSSTESAEALIQWIVRTLDSPNINGRFFRREAGRAFQITIRGYSEDESLEDNTYRSITSPYRSTIEMALEQFIEQLREFLASASVVPVSYVFGLEVTRTVFPAGYGQGSTFRSFQQVSRIWIKPFFVTRSNCAFVACSMARRAQSDPKILKDPTHLHIESGLNLKKKLRRIEAPHIHAGYADFDTLRTIADYYRMKIIVYDNVFVRVWEYSPLKTRRYGKCLKPIELLWVDSHYSPLIRKADVPEDVVKHFETLDEEMLLTRETDRGRERRMKIVAQLARGESVIMKHFTEKGQEKLAKPPTKFDKYNIVSWDLETAPVLYQKEGGMSEHRLQKTYMSGFAWWSHVNDQIKYLQFEGEDACQQMLSKMADMAEQFCNKTWYAHNSGRFDLVLMLREGFFSKWTFKERYPYNPWVIDTDRCMELNGGWISFQIRLRDEFKPRFRQGGGGKRNMSITFRDSLRLMPDSLDRLCKSFKVEHQKKGDVDHNTITIDNWTQQRDKIKEYHAYDLMGLLEVVTSFGTEMDELYEINICKTVTVAALAKNCYFRRFMDINYPVYTLPFELDAFLRKGYMGGRCEAFIIGGLQETFAPLKYEHPAIRNDRWYYYDFTSLYPWACTLDLPYERPTTMKSKDVFVNGRIREDFYGFVEVFVKTNWGMQDPDFYDGGKKAFRPIHAIVSDQKLMFPHLGWEVGVPCVLFSEEIKYAQKFTDIYEYETNDQQLAVAFHRGPILRPFMSEVYKLKQEATVQNLPGKRLILKLVLNSCYGWWGLKTKNRDSVIVSSNKDVLPTLMKFVESEKLIGVGSHECGQDKYHFIRCLRDLETMEYNCAVASAVTSLARIRLHQAITAFESKGGKVVYCDTDSLITNVPLGAFEDLVREFQWNPETNSRDHEGNLLGNLKNEAEELYKTDEEKKRQLEADGGHDLCFDSGFVLGCKFYALKKKTVDGKVHEIAKCKGFAKNNAAKLTYSDFESLCSSRTTVDSLYQRYLNKEIQRDELSELVKPHILHQDQTQFRVGKHSFIAEGTTQFGIEVSKVAKSFRVAYTKGVVLPSGFVAPKCVRYNDFFTPDTVQTYWENFLQEARMEEEADAANPEMPEEGDDFDDYDVDIEMEAMSSQEAPPLEA